MSPGEYSTRVRSDRMPDTIASTFAAAAALASDGRGRLHAPVPLQSWPGIVHGGGLVALFDSVAPALGDLPAPRVLEGRLTSSVPIDTALALEGHTEDGAVRLAVLQGGQTLTSGAVRALSRSEEGPAAVAWSGAAEGSSLPMSEHCLACGALNSLGLRAELRFNEEGIWARLAPGAPWRMPGGRLHPAVGPVLLDEIAWWLGALVTKEGGLTNRIRVTLLEPAAPGDAPLTAAGRFDTVAPVDRKRAFWRTETALMAADGRLLATASIVFRGGAEYSARQLAYFGSRTPPETFRRMFPNHAR